MILLNYVYFLIITYYAYKFLHSSSIVMKDPLVAGRAIVTTGWEAFWVLTFSTGLLAFSAPGSIDLMAVRLLVIETMCLIGIFAFRSKPIWSFPLVVYAVYIVWIVAGCFYAPSAFYGFRVVLKYLFPLVVALFASSVVKDAEVFFKSSLMARKVATICLVLSFVPGMGVLIPGVFWYGTAKAIHFISIMALSLGLFYFTGRKRQNLKYAILFILPCFIWVFRTSIMGSLVAIMGFYFIMYRMKSLPIIAGVLIAGVVAVFTIPSLRNKMFKDSSTSIEQFQQGEVNMENVETNARQAMWTYLEYRLYRDHEIAGSGTGSVQQHMYTHFIFGGLKVPHSDFVQMKCDNGLIGLVLYCLALLSAYLHCVKVHFRARDRIVKLASVVAGASMVGVFVTLYSDNVVNYSMATLLMPFGFYGMMLGLNKNMKR